MNSGKICIPVCGQTAEETIAEIGRAAEFADIVEVRIDCLYPGQIDILRAEIQELAIEKPLIATYRSPEQGGNGSATLETRAAFWDQGDRGFQVCDLEEDVIEAVSAWPKRIASHHDLHGVPSDIDEIYTRLAATGAEIVKIAVTADDITDALPVWKLIERAGSEEKSIIPIAMGEAGKWTRILGLAYGAYLTFASLDAGRETAGGQITVKDMIEVYRVKDLDRDTRVYGVIGDPVSQSLSPFIQNAAFISAREDAVFMHLLVRDLDRFIRRMVRPETREVDLNFGGFSVTMPHKQSIMRHLDEIDPIAAAIGAVNTVKIDAAGRMTGFNTDAHGFISPLKSRFGDLRGAKAAIFGAGGAARACVYALKQEGAEVSVYVRDPQKAAVFAEETGVPAKPMQGGTLEDIDIVVNATPIGMKGALEDQTVFTADQLFGVKFVFDLVTKTASTPLIKEAAKAGIPAIGGIEMLIAQGARQFEIWTGLDAPIDTMRAAIADRMK